ncbi:unnamed protein product [Sphagnum troendelagicum]|uniref:PI31 proteasome regulator N-terminal domain-containing protein n=1 Tax=Sphagnum troendelagicum TaxID=128251 RepID=A0ABP0URB4_9BRYO
MATPGAVLGVIRAARPRLKNATERVAFAVHAAFLAAGYSLVATGTNANSSPGIGEGTEVGVDGWDEMDGAYAFCYSGNNELGLSKSVTVKCLAVGDSLMIDAISSDVDNPVHLELKPSEYAIDGDAANYAEQYTDLPGLVERINSSILSKLTPPAVKPTPSTASPTRIVYPRVPAYGSSDLYPSPGAGVFDPSEGVDVVYFSVAGPNDARWGRMGGLEPGVGVPDTGGIGMVPGARFEPFGPPGVPGFEQNRFARGAPPPPGVHPDLEHFTPGF